MRGRIHARRIIQNQRQIARAEFALHIGFGHIGEGNGCFAHFGPVSDDDDFFAAKYLGHEFDQQFGRIRSDDNGAAIFFVADKTYDERVAAGTDIGDGKLSIEICK